MPTYQYLAESTTGERVRGQLEAPDEPAARRELCARGLTPVELLVEAAEGMSTKLDEDETTLLIHEIGAAAAGRMPLEVALAALAAEPDNRALADVAKRLLDQLHRGTTIGEAVKSLNSQLPAELRGVLQAGVESGDLAGTVERFAEERLASQRIARRIKAAIAYPLVILAILAPIALFLSWFVIPMFGNLYREFDLDLPRMTELVLHTSRQMPEIVVGLLALIFGLPMLLRFVGNKWLLHRVRSATPVLGRLWLWSGQREFAANLASFLELRLPMIRAVALTGETLRDRNMARASRRLQERLETGQSLSTALGQSIHFDRALVALTAWGERHGLLPEALHIATEIFNDRIDQRAAIIRRLMPPITLVVVATLAFVVVASLMLPMVKLIEGLSS